MSGLLRSKPAVVLPVKVRICSFTGTSATRLVEVVRAHTSLLVPSVELLVSFTFVGPGSGEPWTNV
jgi:hypothetical protein